MGGLGARLQRSMQLHLQLLGGGLWPSRCIEGCGSLKILALKIKKSSLFKMDSFPKETHRYAFAMVEAARTMPVAAAEKLDHIKQLRFNVQLKRLRKRINKRIT